MGPKRTTDFGLVENVVNEVTVPGGIPFEFLHFCFRYGLCRIRNVSVSILAVTGLINKWWSNVVGKAPVTPTNIVIGIPESFHVNSGGNYKVY